MTSANRPAWCDHFMLLNCCHGFAFAFGPTEPFFILEQCCGVLVGANSGESRMMQSIVGHPFQEFDTCTMNGSNQRHRALFAAVLASPQRPSPQSRPIRE